MTRRTAARLGWSLWGLTVLFICADLLFTVLNWSTHAPGVSSTGAFDVLYSLTPLAFATVGAIVVSRRPANPIGWLFCSVGVPSTLGSAAYGYGVYALFTHPGSLPAAHTAAWLDSWTFLLPLLGVPLFLFLLVPNGTLLSARWRPVVWSAGAVIALIAAGNALVNPFEKPFRHVSNPYALHGVARQIVQVPVNAAWLVLFIVMAAAVVSLVLRFRRATAEERMQLKWIVSAAVLFGVALIAAAVLRSLSAEAVGELFMLLAFATIPVATGVAILRYRLYDIDVVINRALVYGALTACLALAYVGSVLLLQLALRPLTSRSDLAIAGSTLAVAALFRPARARIQEVVDRRFYRRKYDAQHTLEAFSARLRDEVDLDSLAAELRAVVGVTMQPTHVSLWLRAPGGLR